MVADPAELVHAGEAAEDHVVADGHVAGQRGVVGEHAVVADDAVVGHVAIRQDPVAVADAGDAAAIAGAAIDGHEFADHVAVADHQLDAFAAVLLVLRFAADRRVRVEHVVAADPGRPFDRAMRTDAGTVADLHARADHRVGADLHARTQPRIRVDGGGRVDEGGRVAHSRAAAQRISAQAACSPSTRAMPTYCAMLRMRRFSSTSSSSRSPGTTMRLKRALSTLTR